MTVSRPPRVRRLPLLLHAALALAPVAAAAAWQQPPPAPPPPKPVVIVLPPPPSVRFEQSMQQQQVRDQLQKNAMQEQLRQNTMEAIKRPTAADKAHSDQLDRADQAQREVYRARQRGELDRYQNAVTPRPVIHSQPAPARSGL